MLAGMMDAGRGSGRPGCSKGEVHCAFVRLLSIEMLSVVHSSCGRQCHADVAYLEC